MTDWLLLLLFAAAWLAGWCSRWQWEKARDEPEEMPFNRWARDLPRYGRYKLIHEPPPLAKPGQVRKMLGLDKVEESFDRWARELP